MAIVHVALKSDSGAPPSAAHSEYITRQGAYAKMGEAIYVEPGNMPDFARDRPQLFWEAADVQERANGRSYTELQIALPRELSDEQRISLAREATKAFMGERFAYTMAIHNPAANDKIEQPHLHLMFSERVVDDQTRQMPVDRFFKRNGAKKDRKWNDQQTPKQIRVQWCEMMNRAMESAGIDQRVDPRSLADQGKIAESLLVEPKMLRNGSKEEKAARLDEILEIRETKAVLANMEIAGVDSASIDQADQASQQKLEAQVSDIEEWEAQELSAIDRMIEAIKQKGRDLVEFVARTLKPVAKKKKPEPEQQAELFGTMEQPIVAAVPPPPVELHPPPAQAVPPPMADRVTVSPAPPAELPADQAQVLPPPNDAELQKVIEWLKDKPDGTRIVKDDYPAPRAAKYIDEMIDGWGKLNRPEAPREKAGWERVRTVLMPFKMKQQAERIERLQKRFPKESLARIEQHVKGVQLKIPLGCDTNDKGLSR